MAARFPQLVAKDAQYSVQLMLATMAETRTHGDRIEIRDFGSFALNYRSPRIGRNPKTGATVPVQGKHVPHFKAGKALRERVDLL